MRSVIGQILLLTLLASPAAAEPAPQIIADPGDDADPPVTRADLLIVRRAALILQNEAAWNRADDRKCPLDATRFSLYCALEKATVAVNGSFEHRGAALQQVRFVVDELTADRHYQHRLMNFNNDPATSLADIRHVLRLAEGRIRKRLAAAPAIAPRMEPMHPAP